ncbi:MAG: hydrogenase maturation nickel metallochaperone HypA [Candidatus Aminicenantes bacterium]|nr:hydrogenase maturation nickel metallochaperone HypA [Candidatus Aminicenantes bacterium]
MHELSIVASLVEILEAKAREAGAARVTSVTLRVGEMSGAVPELLASAFDAYKKGTIAERASLKINLVHVRPRCRSCGGSSWREAAGFSCAACGSRDLEVVEGRELVLERLEVEVDDDARQNRHGGRRGRPVRRPRRPSSARERA